MTPEEYYGKKLRRLSDADARIFSRPSLEYPAVKKVHLVGVCGTAMGSLAGLLRQAGYAVSGSDTGCYPPMDGLIAELGITFFEGFDPANLAGADVIVVGNASGPQNPEAAYARQQGLPTLSLSEAVAEFFIRDKRSLVVAGTHGKTSTSGLLAHVFASAGEDPSYLIGGVPQGFGKGFNSGKGKHFIIEGDEYDTAYFDKRPKFLHYRPTTAIITSVEFDHVDIYDDLDDYRQAFHFLTELVPEDEPFFVWGDGEGMGAFAEKKNARTYGLREGNGVTATGVAVTPAGQRFTLVIDGKQLGEMETPLFGEHNLHNVLSVCAVALSEGLPFGEVKKGIGSFAGMKRRQEVIAEENGVLFIDDFAHHPTAVRETLKAIRMKYPGRRIVALFEPRSNTSRTKVFEQGYIESFDGADLVYLKVPPMRHNDSASNFIDAEKVVREVSARGTEAQVYETSADLVKNVSPILQSGDVVLIMSNGSFDGVYDMLLDAWRAA
ncbi:MAG TPA: UDP-N-acetylmuramate--L-alanine ligase [Candidatus Paceibacterota bacterium]|jgi:UDP-N-acetylmuramate: L-alanyl-gamma-D-glutamyl-meso-diaminopimelate ligase